LIGLELREAARAFGEVLLEPRVHVGREVALHEIGEEPYEIGAAVFRHGASGAAPDEAAPA